MAGSDIDIFIDPVPGKAFGFLPYIDAYQTIQDALGQTVDYCTRNGLHTRLRRDMSDIRKEIAGIGDLTKDADENSFSDSWAMRRAVEHALLIIAEAAKHIPEELKEMRGKFPWAKIHGLGNMLRHEYRHIDPKVL